MLIINLQSQMIAGSPVDAVLCYDKVDLIEIAKCADLGIVQDSNYVFNLDAFVNVKCYCSYAMMNILGMVTG